jgi:hypothetical protein
MPRRGGSSGGRSGKHRRPQAPKGGQPIMSVDPAAKNRTLPQKPRLLPMVAPTGTCPSGKLRYGTSHDAEEALRRALENRILLKSVVVEERWYPKPGDKPCECGGYHLTSKPSRRPQ